MNTASEEAGEKDSPDTVTQESKGIKKRTVETVCACMCTCMRIFLRPGVRPGMLVHALNTSWMWNRVSATHRCTQAI